MNVFISCGKNKAKSQCQAKDMYQGTLFKRYLNLARQITDDNHIYIISAKYGLLSLYDIIKPYDYTLLGKSKEIKKKWGEFIYKQSLKRHVELNNSIYYLPNEYMEGLITFIDLNTIKTPLKNLSFFQRNKYISEIWKKNH